MNRSLLSLLFIMVMIHVNAQIRQIKYNSSSEDPLWVQLMYDENPNVKAVKTAYEEYYNKIEFVKTNHTQYYKRWIRENIDQTDIDGNIVRRNNSQGATNWNTTYMSQQNSSEWIELGPWQYDHEAALELSVQSPGAAHIYTVEQAPSNDQVVYAGSATAGLWRSEDKGMHWDLMTRDMLINTVYSIAIDPSNPDIVYFEGGGNIWKSTSGGSNAYATGDAAFQGIDMWTRDLRISPTNANTLIAATDEGLFKSNDAALNWSLIEAGEFMEIEFHPTNPDLVYAVKLNGNATEFYRSTNGGDSFSLINGGWPVPSTGDENRRCEIAVSPANPNLVYVLASGEAGGSGGLYGIYLSTDAGLNFSFQCCGTGPGGAPDATSNPNILGWSGDGSGDGGQYYYDLAMGASPTNPDKVFAAGISMWRSEDSGANWELNGHWVTWAGEHTLERYTHADVHDIKFFDNGNGWDMWIASDGGLYYSSNEGDNIEPRMYGIQGTTFWGFQAGFQDGDIMLGGTYHNGTLIKYKDIYRYGAESEASGGWLAEGAGDNVRGFVNYGDNKIAYDDGGSFTFSEERLVRPPNRAFDGNFNCTSSYVTGEYGTFGWHPHNYNTFYSPVNNELYLTTDGGLNWELIQTFAGEKIIQVEVAPSNPDVIYVTAANDYWDHTMYRTQDAGVSWTEINPTSGESGGNQWRHKYVAIDGLDENKLWCILIGNQNGNKVLRTTNGGDSWSNYTGSSTIVNEDLRSITHQLGSNGGVYIGSRHGVFYRDESMSDWQLHGSNLPMATNCDFLQPYYGEQKIRVATNRGVFECDFETASSPIARISVEKTSLNIGVSCLEQPVQFVDFSILKVNENTTWSWSFEGGFPQTSSERNPTVVYSTAGTWDVTLTVTDDNGSHSVIMTDFIQTINETEAFPLTEDFEESFPPEKWILNNPTTSPWEWDWVPEDESNNKVASFPNYWVNSNGEAAQMILPSMDFTNVNEPSFTFDYTHRTWSSYIDGLAIKYRTSINTDWITLWERYDPELNVDGTDTFWWDNAGSNVNWETVSINLDDLVGESCVQFCIENIGGYGNHTWVDNVSISTKPKANFTASSNTICADEESILFTDLSSHSPESYNWTFEPATVTYINGTSSSDSNPEVVFNEPGSYSVALSVSNQYGDDTLNLLNHINVSDCSCPEDLNLDGIVDIQDFLMLLAAYGCSTIEIGCVGDFDEDGITNINDMLHFLSMFDVGCL